MKVLIKDNLSKKVLIWYDKNKRDLPWRKSKKDFDPYQTWISEIMLQQTTVEAVKPFFHKFINRWPTIKKLSESNVEDVMDAWSGLGYYSRAKNIHKSAIIINKKHNNQIPTEYEELIKLPGIGPYTAGAILTIAFNKKASVIDSNIERIILRIRGIRQPKEKVKKELIKISEDLCPTKRSGDYVQAMMDLGSAICKAKNPLCNLCPIQKFCLSYAKDLTNSIPIKKLTKPKKIREANLFWIVSDQNRIFLQRRPLEGLLPGMLEFPSSEWINKNENMDNETIFPIKGHWEPVNGKVVHIFSHFQLVLKIYICRDVNESILKGMWKKEKNIPDLELPSLMKKVYKHVFSHIKN
tara:strand:+ start:1225 stop:2283 length:1059 start_codon:yes stop_codon:yes gene_type:complete